MEYQLAPIVMKRNTSISFDYVAYDYEVVKFDWLIGGSFVVGDFVSHLGKVFQCINNHTSDSTNEPINGADASIYWSEVSKESVFTNDGSFLVKKYRNIGDDTIYFTVRSTKESDSPDDTDVIFQRVVTPPHLRDNMGLSQINITESQTDIDPDTYFYEIEIKDSANPVGQQSSSHKGYGEFIIQNELTKT